MTDEGTYTLDQVEVVVVKISVVSVRRMGFHCGRLYKFAKSLDETLDRVRKG